MILELKITTGSDVPIYRQIVDRLRRAMLGGQLPPGSQLPSVRVLAEQLVINPNTVVRAYQELARDGVVQSQQGRGFFVAEKRQVYTDQERLRRLNAVLEPLVSEAIMLDFSPDEVLQAGGAS